MNAHTLIALSVLTLAATAADRPVYPGQSIQAAIDVADAGDRIIVHAGTYYEHIDLRGKLISVVSVAGSAATIIDGSGGAGAVVQASNAEPAGTLVSGFTIRGGTGRPFPSSYGYDYYGGGVFVGGTAKLRVEDCEIVENGIGIGTFGGGVYAGGSGTLLECERCIIRGNNAWASGGGALVDHSALIRLCRCTVYGNTSTDFFGHQGGIGMANDGDAFVENSIVWGNSGEQVAAFGPPYNWGTVATVRYSDVQNGFPGTGNIDVNPAFEDAGQGNFALQPSSSCIDTGDPASAPDPDGTRADMGAVPFDHGCAVVTSYCTAGTTTSGCLAAVSAVGTPSPSQSNGFVISVGDVEGQRMGVIFYGLTPTAVAWAVGNPSYVCVAAPVLRTGAHNSGGDLGACNGLLSIDFNAFMAANPSALGSPFTAGDVFYAQGWFRDGGAIKGSNLSNALRFRLCP